MKKLDLYIIKKFLGTFFFMISLFVIIAVIFDISEKIDDFIEKDAPFSAIITQYYFSFIPWLYSILSSLLIFLAVILFTSQMAQRNEIIAILSNGIRFRRMLLPYFVSATVLFFISIFLNNWIIPKTNQIKLDFEAKYYKTQNYNIRTHQIHREISPGSYIYIDNFDGKRKKGYKVSFEEFKDGKLVKFLRAQQIKWDDKKELWTIINYHSRSIGDNGTELLDKGSRLDTVLTFEPKDIASKVSFIEAMDYNEISEYIDKEKQRGSQRVKFYEFEHYKRFAIPFSIFPLTLIGLSFASRKKKRGVGLHLATGITIGAFYVFFNKVAEVFAVKGGLPADWAVWTPNIIFTLVAIVAYFKTPK